jgi:hypothetical protein
MVTILSFSVSRGSEREWVCVDAVVRGAKRLLDDLQARSFAKPAPGASGRAVDFSLGDLFNRSVFDERTCAEAISHGWVSFLSVAAGGDGL